MNNFCFITVFLYPCMYNTVFILNNFDIIMARHVRADIPLIKGEYELAEQRYMEAVKSALEIGAVLQADIELQGMAMSLAGQGRHEKGLRLFGAADQELFGEEFAEWQQPGLGFDQTIFRDE